MNTPTSEITPEVVAAHGLSPEEYAHVLHALGREPNLVELGIFSVMWSEHCSYKSSRIHLKKLPTEAPWVICGPGENAGRDRHRRRARPAIFKMESHNHPSYIEPYQGAATGVGGILRDVFTMGARPVANLNALRFGRPDHPKMKHLVQGVVAGIGGYGNCVGVPTVGGETNFHPAYDGNILVNAMTVGVADAGQDLLFGRDRASAIRSSMSAPRPGATASTARPWPAPISSEDSEAKRPTVQVGDPFTEKLLIEACLELMATDAIVAIQDMGAAGLTSVERRDGDQRQGRHHARHGQGAVPRRGHDALRDDAEREPGAHADGAQARQGADGRGDLQEVGAGLRGDRRSHRHRPHGADLAGRDGLRHSAGAARRRRAAV